MIFLELFLTFFKIGAFTFGGGYAMLPLIQSEVISNGWLDKEAILDFVAVAESTPGPFAINIATYIGSEMGGLFGAFCATLGVVLPSFVIILIVAPVLYGVSQKPFGRGCDDRTAPRCGRAYSLRRGVYGIHGILSVGLFAEHYPCHARIPRGFCGDARAGAEKSASHNRYPYFRRGRCRFGISRRVGIKSES